MRIINLFLFALIAFNFSYMHAATVTKLKAKKLLLTLETHEVKQVKQGSQFYILSPKGKKIGLAVVAKTKGNKALARLKKGQARRNFNAQLKGAKPVVKKHIYGGIQIGLTNNLLTTTVNGISMDLSGNGVSLKGFYDHPLWDKLWVRGSAGYQQFIAESGCPSCTTDIGYFTIDGLARYMLSKATLRPWFGAFYSAMIPLNNNSTALTDVSTTSTYGVALGADYSLNSKWMLPFSIEYALFPTGDEGTSSSTIQFKGGVGFKF